MTDLAVDEALLEAITPEFVAELDDDELDLLLEVLLQSWEVPGRRGLQPHQLPPEAWEFAWLFTAGRGAGKTMAASDEFYRHVMEGPPCDPFEPGGHRLAIVGPTLGDVATSCWAGPSGLRRIDPRIRMVTRRGGTFIEFPNGAEAKCTGGKSTEDSERLRAHGNLCRLWVEEAAACKALASIWTQAQFAVRHGPRARVQLTSTPKATPAFRRLAKHPRVAITRAATKDNVHLSPADMQRLYEDHAGTRLEAQELEGRILDEVPGALWAPDVIDENRLLTAHLDREYPRGDETRELWLRRILGLTTVLVGVDPATSGRGDRSGLVVVGGDSPRKRGGNRHAYFLEDRTGLMVPSTIELGEAKGDEHLQEGIEGWAERAAEMAYRWQADAVVVERNRLGRTARSVLRAAGLTSRIVEVDAKGSKANRADALRQAWRRRCHIVDSLSELELEMTTWVPADGDDPEFDPEAEDLDTFNGSPDALDAAGHAAVAILGIGQRQRASSEPLGSALQQGWGGAA